MSSKKQRLENVKSVIDMLREWYQHVDALNECSYTDRILEGALEKLQQISEEPFKN